MSASSSKEPSGQKPPEKAPRKSMRLSKGWIFLALLVLGLGFLRLALKADWTFELLRGQAEQLLSESLGAEGERIRVEIDSMSGDLLEFVDLQGLRIYRETSGDSIASEKPLISLEQLHVDYVLLALLSKRIEVRKLRMNGLEVDAEQHDAGQWNLMALLPPPDPETEQAEDESPFGYAVDLKKFSLSESALKIRAPDLLPDEELRIDELKAEASFYFFAPDDELQAGLDQLSFALLEGRLPEALQFETSAGFEQETITLNRLALSTGRSLLEAEGRHALDGSATEAELRIPELSRADLAAYLDELPEFETLSLQARTSGDFSDLELRLEASSERLFQLVMGATLEITPEPLLRSAFLEIDELNSGRLLQDEELGNMLSVGRFEARLDGRIPFEDYESAEADLSISLARSRYDALELSALSSEISLRDGQLDSKTTLQFPEQQELALTLRSGSVWEDIPPWELEIESLEQGLNPGYFAGDDALDGRIPFSLTASGNGFEPPSSDSPSSGFWRFNLELTEPVVSDFEATDTITLDATVNALLVDAALNFSSRGGSGIELTAAAREWQKTRPEWNFELLAESLNLAELLNNEALESNINLELGGQGEGYMPEDALADLRIDVKPSRFLDEPIERINSELTLENGILNVSNTEFESRFFNGFLSARQKLDDIKDEDNRLDFDFEVRNLESFAEVAGLDTLHSRGQFSGQLRPVNGVLQFDSELNFAPIQADSIYIEELSGTFGLVLRDEPELELILDASKPRYGTIQLHDIRLENETLFATSETRGSLDLRVLRTEDFGLFHKAEFQLSDSFAMQNSRFSIHEDGFNLELSEPFEIRLRELESESPSFRMDRLHLVSDQGGEFQFMAEQGPGDYLMANIKAERLDLGACQDALLNERFVDTYFSGRIDLLLEDEELTADIDTELRDISYDGLNFDRFGLVVNIVDNRLTSETRLEHEDELLAESEFDLPFRLGDKENFPDSFYDEPVSGFFRINTLALKQYEAFLENVGLRRMEGNINLDSELSGVAGAPELQARFGYEDGSISGVPVNEAFFEMNYNNRESELELLSEVRSMDQVAARLEGTLPLFIDMRSLTLEDPDGSEGLNLKLETSDFQLAAFNDFIDRDLARDLRGKLNAEVDITGTVGQPEPRGNLALSGGRVYLTEQNITLNNIKGELDIEPDEIRINDISAESSGSFSVDGSIGLTDFVPYNFDVRARARNFRVSNTREMDLYVSMDNRLEGTLEEPSLRGQFTLARGEIYLDNFGEEQVEVIVLEGEEESSFGEDFYNALAIEMNVLLNRRVRIRNSRNPELDMEMDGKLDAVKAANQELELFGEVRLPDGTATTLGRTFTLDDGSIIFSGPVDNPQFDISLSYRIRRQDDVRIIYIISGTADEPEFTFDSEPEMAFQDIISYTLFGRPFYALEGWEQGVSGNAGGGGGVADAALDLLLDRLQNVAAERLGVDVVEIDSSTRSGGGTRIKAGKFVSDRMFIALVQELGSDPNSQVMIEYMLRRNLELIFTGSEDYRSGVDVQWKLDY